MLEKLIQEKVITAVKSAYDVDVEEVVVEHPNLESWGDYATNIGLMLAKTLKQSPLEIAKTLSYELSASPICHTFDGKVVKVFEKIYHAPPGFVNFILSNEWLYLTLHTIQKEAKNYGTCAFGDKKRVLIEYSNPNPNKPLHIGHARNNFLGVAVANILEAVGYDVIKANYVNTWGTHICKAMLMYQKYGNNEEPTKQPDHYVGDFYIMYEQKEQEDPELKEEVAEMFRKLEAGDKETHALWEKIVGWSKEGWERTYADQGVEFDVWFHQHDYKDSGKEVVQLALDKGIAEKDPSGAVIARLEKYDIPDKVLLRSDGTSVYSTQDLQMAMDNVKEYDLDKRIYVVDYRQSDYFSQIFKVLEVFGPEWADKLYHLSYGTIELPEGKMSSRKGLVVRG